MSRPPNPVRVWNQLIGSRSLPADLQQVRRVASEDVEQERRGEADDVEVVALDPRDEPVAWALDRVSARTADPFPRPQVRLDLLACEAAERHSRHLVADEREAVAQETEPRDDLVRVPGELAEHRP